MGNFSFLHFALRIIVLYDFVSISLMSFIVRAHHVVDDAVLFSFDAQPFFVRVFHAPFPICIAVVGVFLWIC